MSNLEFKYYIPTKILFGEGILERLHKETLPGRKALIVTSAGQSVKKFGYLDRLIHQLEISNIEYVVFDKILTNPTRECVMEGSEIAKKSRCDFIIGLGGGSSIDASKAIAIVATNEGDLWDYFYGGTAKFKPVKNKTLPVVAIATTAGTGSEADQWMVISNQKTSEKIGFGFSKTFPVLAVVDPTLMLSVPPELTAYQGLDALFHSTEGYLSKKANEISDLFAIKSIALVGKSLIKAVKNGNDIDSRADVALASTLSGMLLAITSLTAEHAMEDGLSGLHPELPHGIGLALISEAYYKHIAEIGITSGRMIDMARALGVNHAKCSMDFVDALIKIKKACGVNDLKMSEYGIKKHEFPKIVELAKANAGSEFYAERKVLSDEECISILENSYR